MFYIVIGVWVIWMNSFIKIVHLIVMLSSISKFYFKNYRKNNNRSGNGWRYRQSQNDRMLIITESR